MTLDPGACRGCLMRTDPGGHPEVSRRVTGFRVSFSGQADFMSAFDRGFGPRTNPNVGPLAPGGAVR